METGLSYDDVLLIPKRSSVKSRKDVSTETRLTKKIKLNMPVVSANMDTVTESEMAITMAQLGGIGIIHRFNTTEEQVMHVQRVKRYRNAIIDKPLTIKPNYTLCQAKDVMKDNGVTGLLVTNDDNRLIGILTSRDIRFKPSEETLVSELMTSKEKLVVGNVGISIEDAKKKLMDNRIEKLPIINEDWTLAGLVTSKDIYNKTEYPNSSLDEKHRLIVGAAIGVKGDSIDRAEALVKAGVDVLVIDIAHGHSDLAINTLKEVKEKCPDVEVIAGNVATAEGTKDLIEAGADSIKIGVGPGSICTTRIVTGSGYPQMSAVMNCAKEADKHDVPIIADGGIKIPGDITKAIAAGASTVMLGNLLAGTEESPGMAFIKNGKRFKVIRGMASFGAKLGREAKEKSTKDSNDAFEFVAEGVEAVVPYRGSVKEVLAQLIGGFRSGMSYCGATKISELRGKADFVKITAAGARESNSHDVSLV
jgi:IMP dehydrogenase